MTAIVVLIAETTSNFILALQKHYITHVVRSGKQGIQKVEEISADVIVLDAISLKTSGERICKQLRKTFPDKIIIHLHPNKQSITNDIATSTLYHPIPSRKLIASIDVLTSKKQIHIVKCGEFALDIERRILTAHDRETILTPKESALVLAFLNHPNQVLDRSWLMQHIWQTDYTGDTRTLNVHIRAIREAMEINASKPRYIKTIRGVGYCFEPNPTIK